MNSDAHDPSGNRGNARRRHAGAWRRWRRS
ncbi:hypothetical protein BURK1_03703 [Burkholderiales bacterium]|nr:hypothetical protein BURK1_03703 [Burkholderiales bacterium]